MANKVQYGIKNVYYAVATTGTGGAVTYGTPVAIPGARSISLSAAGDNTKWYADDNVYFAIDANNGYEGDLTVALIPDSFRTDVLGEVLDNKGFYVETSGAPVVEFALLFEFSGDQNATRHCMYRCTASRPDVASSTVEETIEPQEQTISITAMPRLGDQVVKASCPASATTSYSAWFTTVQEPTA